MTHLLPSMLLLFLPIVFGAKNIEPLKRRVFGETFVEEPTWFCIHKLKADKTWKTFKTPGYPKSLDVKHSRCTWKISATGKMNIRVAFRGIGLIAEDPAHCSTNYLEIIDEILGKSQTRLCGRKTTGDIVSKGNKLRMDLQVDPSETQQRGFSISYIATKAKSGFYGKKSFNEKPLPPMKKKKPESRDEEETKKKKKDTKKGDKGSSNSGPIFINSDGQLYRYPKKRQLNNSGFKPLGNSSGSSSGISTLAIIGIVIGALIGTLIIIVIFRKLFLKKNDKEKDGEIVQGNSGLQKINMTHENVVNAKRNILAAAVVVNKKEPRATSPLSDHMREERKSWSSSDDGFRTNRAPERLSRNPSYRHDRFVGNGVTNLAYEDGVPRQMMNNNPPPRMIDDGRRSKRNSYPTKKIPYRHNSNRAGLEQKRAIEALNDEEFCHYDSVFNPQNPAKSGESRHRSKSRRSIRTHSVNGGNSPDSDISNVFTPNSSTKISKSAESPTRDIDRQRELPGRNENGREDRLTRGISRTLDHGDKSFSNHSPPKRRRTIEETVMKARKDFKTVEKRKNSEKKSKNPAETTSKDMKISRTRSRFDLDPPSPSLPRHVVPSSRR